MTLRGINPGFDCLLGGPPGEVAQSLFVFSKAPWLLAQVSQGHLGLHQDQDERAHCNFVQPRKVGNNGRLLLVSPFQAFPRLSGVWLP